ncbi:MAG: hypothetical protein HZB26_16600 [Candidatus Hydrogenedentes bacterium]|nr:hypothetical protein [Candidatus Hydrogenedentota bacterium]
MGVTFRSVAIALALMPFNALWLASTQVIWISGQPTTLSLFYNVVFLLFWIILLNLAVKRWIPGWELSPPELLVIYTMLSIASALASIDFIDVLVPMLPFLDHFGPLEGRYGAIRGSMPEWLLVQDRDALRSYYIGQESFYTPANFVPWLLPLAWWSAFIIALCAVMWGLNLVFRKQWTENEKLSYPVIQVPMLLATEPETLFKNKVFWTAFALAAGIDLLNGLQFLFPLLPRLPLVHIVNLQAFFPERPWLDMGATWVSFYPFAIGMCFFMPTDLAFSCWFFYIFWKAQRVLASHIGMHGMPGFPFIEEQTAGGYYAIALLALWLSRRQIKRMALLALGKPAEEHETPWERREARLAALLICGGFTFLLYFCWRAQMTMSIALAFFVLYFLLSVAITRMRAELGPPSHDLPAIGPGFQIVNLLGPTAMAKSNPADLPMMGMLNFFNRAYRSHPMPHGLEALRIAERLHMDYLRYLLAMATAVAAGTVFAFWGLLVMMEKYGATQVSGLGEWFGREQWDNVNLWLTNPPPHMAQPTMAIGIGLLCSFGLAALRMNLAWWPFHPVGYAVSGSWSMDQLWASILAVWIIKSLVLKYGGAKAYRPAIPFFVGLLMGDFIAGAFWNLYGTFLGVETYHFWPY